MIDIPTALAELTLIEKAALLSGHDVWRTRAIPRLGVPRIWMSDGPHGLRKQLGDTDHLGLGQSERATCFPTAATIANTWDEPLAERIGTALGAEAAAQGVHVLLGPGLNIKRSPLGGRNFEYFSEDPELSGRLAAAYVRGIQSQGVAATPKHFAVNSQELRRMVSDSVVDERTLRELYLTAFEIVVRESAPWAIMSSYNLVNGMYAHESAHLLTTILRGEWGFDGAVISDWGGGNDAVTAVAAGGTIEMPSPGFDSVRAIVAAVENDTLDVSALDARVTEVLLLIERVTAEYERTATDDASHHALAREAAAAGAVLLRNENGVLPLAAGTRVALIGDFARTPRYQGAGSSAVNPTRLSTLEGSISETALTLTGFAPGFTRDGRPDSALQQEAVALARSADVVVLALGLPESFESEGIDRLHLTLPEAQLSTLEAVSATGTPVIVILSGGGAVETPWLGSTSALLHGYLGGQAGAEGLWDVITGAAEPGGRLAETLPVRLGDDPTTERFPSQGRTAEYREGLFARYRFHDSAGVAPAFGFGFGLGYTTFAYSDLTIDDDGVECVIRNTGARAGSDVVQFYVRRSSSSLVSRPRTELKGFTKVHLLPGEERRVRIPFTDRTFRHFDTTTGTWQVESGTFEILVGPNLGNLPLRAEYDVVGTVSATEGVNTSSSVPSRDDHSFETLLGRPVPSAEWDSAPLGYNTPMNQLGRAKSGLARAAFGILERRRRRAEASGTPDLNLLFLYNAPFRIIDKMSGGLATRRLTRGVLTLVNGQTFRGLGQIVGAFVSGRRAEKRTRIQFEQAAAGSETSRSR
ncbi:glycoside hydrolase family 3 C-terminal domain-containing protein [Agromyces atrinae]|uniref:glycoside hydrolase family 3 protein n=1 Tax=Agromyces atrinae TaxID=592376 RepID=UPI001F57EE24|nr:glycoside hydrolase family 3 protein [Agromyces atrinae]MCI2956861.1 glycoside hydrolase family 3 C-terminal domain-containing protein [Agromyces atrinae]